MYLCPFFPQNLEPDSVLSQLYIDNARELVQRQVSLLVLLLSFEFLAQQPVKLLQCFLKLQVALGGYRLAQLLNKAFDP
jgi:hypothetical protein